MWIDSSKIPGFEIGNEHEDDEWVSYFEYPKVNWNSWIKKTQQERLLEAFLDWKKPLSNISTIITCVILAWFGVGILKGFAITLGIGVLLSMFSAIIVTRTFLLLVVRRGLEKRLWFFGMNKKNKLEAK